MHEPPATLSVRIGKAAARLVGPPMLIFLVTLALVALAFAGMVLF